VGLGIDSIRAGWGQYGIIGANKNDGSENGNNRRNQNELLEDRNLDFY
jgi:hypothetical protein